MLDPAPMCHDGSELSHDCRVQQGRLNLGRAWSEEGPNTPSLCDGFSAMNNDIFSNLRDSRSATAVMILP